MASPKIQHLLTQTSRFLQRRGVDYADLRWVEQLHEELVVQNLQVQHVSHSTTEGVSIRVLHRGAWGYASSCQFDPATLKQTAGKALEMSKAVAGSSQVKVKFPPGPAAKGRYETPMEVDPFRVEMQKKLDYLMWTTQVLKDHSHIKTATAMLEFFRTDKLFCSTEGSLIEQRITESGGTIEAVAGLDHEIQKRSFPSSNGSCLAQAGYEYVKGLDFVGEAARVRKEAVALLRAKECPSGTRTVILLPDQLIFQLHESCGHPAELDRALGMELSFAGGSFLTPDLLGKFRYGSKRVNITADATTPSGCGTFAYDDEGVPARKTLIIREGIFVDYLSSRESAAAIGRSSSGAMRADGWNSVPIVRMTNVNLEPGEGTLREMIGETKKGLLMATNKSWSIDDLRLNFQFGAEIAWEIRHGKIGQVLKNPVYTGITPEFWGSCSAVAGPEEWKLYGVPNCAKGEPVQVMHVGHGASPARFEKIQVGTHAAR